ncbi:TlpA family protein disulfide reductase [Anatilimnocola sp. NA78]|uniref:TlpA family protein disulfide reductase n=1 Tax=Anatilimnocola sp. NA78 TaxID=3415683 RepID=UPI003CE4B779
MNAILMLLAAALPAQLSEGTLHRYEGSMVATKDDGDPRVKEFSLLAVVGPNNAARTFDWVITETGRGSWSWTERFGRWNIDAARREDVPEAPALMFERTDGKSVVPLCPLLFTAESPLAKGQKWTEDRYEYEVAGEATRADQACWVINVRTPYGPKRTLWVAKASSLIVAVRETVFVGQGVQHELTFELKETKQLPTNEYAKTTQAFNAWLDLRANLQRPARHERADLNDEQLALARKQLASLESAAEETPLAPFAAAAAKDIQNQKGRAGAMQALRDAAVGKPLPELKLTDLSGKQLDAAAWKDKVLVLHFWEYRDAPLEEPYGQVGYLDFASRKHADKAVIVGVNVDERLAVEDTRRTAIASARRLKSFMNLSYNIALDDGALLKQLGDPRAASGKLPLFVVVSPNGKIATYHAGLYEIKPEQGLKELEAAITAAAK